MSIVRAFLFPGQGSQVVSMGKDLYEKSQSAREVFDLVDDAVGEKLTNIMFNGPAEQLLLTNNAQPAIASVSLALLHVMEKDFNFDIAKNVNFLAGHSLGEYAALGAAKCTSIHTIAKLLRSRGDAMLKSSPLGLGTMFAIIGISDLSVINKLIDDNKQDNEVCVIANDNSIGQVIISGNKNCVQKIASKAKEVGARMVMELSVSGAFHSPLMQQASEEMGEILKGVTFSNPIVPIIGNVNAMPITNGDEIPDLLVKQITSGVRWRESMDFLVASGVNEIVEIGNGNVLSGLMKRINPDVNRVNIQSLEDIELYLSKL